MQNNLAKLLVQRGMIREGTDIDVEHMVRGISSFQDTLTRATYRVKGATACKNSGTVFFRVINEVGTPFRISCNDVVGIDGMPTERAAASQFLTEDGNPIPQGRKRGRKRKDEIEALRQAALHDGDEDAGDAGDVGEGEDDAVSGLSNG